MPEREAEETNAEVSETTPSEIIHSIETYPFEFGFKYPLEQERSSFYWAYGRLNLKYQAAQTTDPVWYGNCIDDVRLTSEALKEKLPQEAMITIWNRVAKKMNTTYRKVTHYTTYVELPGNEEPSLITDIDHSQFYTQLLETTDTTITSHEIELETILNTQLKEYHRDASEFFELSEYTLPNNDACLILGKVNEKKGILTMTLRLLIGKNSYFDIPISTTTEILNKGNLPKVVDELPEFDKSNSESFERQGIPSIAIPIIKETFIFLSEKLPPKIK